jgi:hypothetical protein
MKPQISAAGGLLFFCGKLPWALQYFRLVAARLLKPLGNPAQNGIKFFATSELLELVKDHAWLAKMTNAVNQHWYPQNARKKGLIAVALI